jgi:hypothetical protein
MQGVAPNHQDDFDSRGWGIQGYLVLKGYKYLLMQVDLPPKIPRGTTFGIKMLQKSIFFVGL